MAAPRNGNARRANGRKRILRIGLAAVAVAVLFPRFAFPMLETEPRTRTDAQELQAIPLPVTTGPAVIPGEPELVGAWELSSDNRWFGSYSAMTSLGDGRIAAFSDRGARMIFSVSNGRPELIELAGLPQEPDTPKILTDIESVAYDATSGNFWLGLEGLNAISRIDMGMTQSTTVRPRDMSDWSLNSGAEALTRLADGRFLVISEGTEGHGQDDMPGLVFAGDPVAGDSGGGAAVTRFRFKPQEGYRATEMAALPDGRVLILMRSWRIAFPIRFVARLALADPKTIVAGERWAWETVAVWEDDRIPLDNYEGMAVIPEADGSLSLWVISDDNDMQMQRSLLLHFRWRVPALPEG